MAINHKIPGERFGLISDTHGLFRREIPELFKGVDHILHAGDIGKPAVLIELEKIAPVTAVLGNVDIPAWFPGIGRNAIVENAGKRILIQHDLAELDTDPPSEGITIVIHGHTHKPSTRQHGGVRYINPGSAGPERFPLPVSVALMDLKGEIRVQHLTIKTT
jgi:putative phosphoesterase